MSVDSQTEITRRIRRAHGGLPVAAAAPPAQSAGATPTRPAPATVLDIADWSYYWYGIERVKLARGTLINGMQMFVEHWIPTVVRHPYSVVARARRIRSGIGLDEHAGRPARMGVALPRAGLQGLPRRSTRVRAEIHIIRGCTGSMTRRRPPSSASAATIGATGADHTQWPGRGDATDPAIAQVTGADGTADGDQRHHTRPVAQPRHAAPRRHRPRHLRDARRWCLLRLGHRRGPPRARQGHRRRRTAASIRYRGRQLSLFTPIPIAIVAAETSKTNDPSAAAAIERQPSRRA